MESLKVKEEGKSGRNWERERRATGSNFAKETANNSHIKPGLRSDVSTSRDSPASRGDTSERERTAGDKAREMLRISRERAGRDKAREIYSDRAPYSPDSFARSARTEHAKVVAQSSPPRREWKAKIEASIERTKARNVESEASSEKHMRKGCKDLPLAIRTVFEHEDALRSALKHRLQQLGDIVTISAEAFRSSTRTNLGEACRSVATEAASIAKDIASRQHELQAEIEVRRRSRLNYAAAPGMPPTRDSALTNEVGMLREEVKALKVRERQLQSQVSMLTAFDSDGQVKAKREVAEELLRLNQEVTALRTERELWRTRALAAEAKILESPEQGMAAIGCTSPRIHDDISRLLFLQADRETKEHFRLIDDNMHVENSAGGGQDWGGAEEERGWEGLGTRKFCDTGGQDAKNGMIEGLTAELDALRQHVDLMELKSFKSSSQNLVALAASNDSGGNGGVWEEEEKVERRRVSVVDRKDILKIQLLLSISYNDLKESTRQRAALRHSILLDLLFALKDAGHTLRPALLQVTSIGPSSSPSDASDALKVDTVLSVEITCPQDEDATAGVLLAALMEQAARADSVLKTGAVSQYIAEISLAN